MFFCVKGYFNRSENKAKYMVCFGLLCSLAHLWGLGQGAGEETGDINVLNLSICK